MVVVQALLSFLSRSVGKIARAAFGWAVLALFGERPKSEQTFLSFVVAAAAAWPVLVAGVVFPKIATFILAAIPMSKHAPTFALRIAWIVLALGVPSLLGFVLARRSRAEDRTRGFARLIQGFRVTVALAAAFFVILVVTPVRLLAAALRRRNSPHVPLVVEIEHYGDVCQVVARVLTGAGIDVRQREAPWTVAAPTKILRSIGGSAFRRQLPERLFYLAGPEVELTVTPNGVSLQGKEPAVSRAHGMIAEATSETKALQTMEAEAQEIEREIKAVWDVFRANPVAHERSIVLTSRIEEIGADIARAEVTWEDWQVLYRQTLQLGRALHGDRALLAKRGTEENMTSRAPDLPADPRLISTGHLLKEIVGTARQLISTEVALAKAEAKSDIKKTVSMAKWLGAAAVCGVLTIAMLLVAVTFALSALMAGWLAALVLAGVLLLSGSAVAALGWSRRPKEPLEVTRRTLKEDFQWVKNHAA